MQPAITAQLGSRHATSVIYGATVGLALVVALQDHPPAAAVVAGTLAATAVAVALAEIYSDVVGSEVRRRRLGIGRRELARLTASAAATALGAGFPALFFVLAAGGILGTATAFEVAKWSGLGLLTLYGFAAARLTGAGLPEALLHAAAVSSVGGFLIAVKSLLH